MAAPTRKIQKIESRVSLLNTIPEETRQKRRVAAYSAA